MPLACLGSQDERTGLAFALTSGPVNTLRITSKAGLVQLEVLTVLPSLNSLTLFRGGEAEITSGLLMS